MMNCWHEQQDSKPQPLSSQTNTPPFSQTGQMIGLCCKYLSVRCIWLYVIIISPTSFRVNPHSILCLNVKKLPARSRRHIWSLSDSNKICFHNLSFSASCCWENKFVTLASLAKWLSVVYELSGCGFEFRCCYLNFRYSACFEQEVPLHSGKV